MLNFINKHKGLSIVCGLALILFIIVFIILISLFITTGKGTYGDRLDGIEDVKLSDSFLNEVKTSLEENDNIESANVRLQGKIVYIEFQTKSGVNTDAVKSISDEVLEKFSEDELKFYDFSFIVKWVNETDDGEKNTAIEGYKHHNKTVISWTKG